VPPCVLQYRTLPPSQGGLQGCHVSNGSKTHLPDRKSSDAAMCTVAPEPLGGLRCTACPAAPNPASLLGGLCAATRLAVHYGSWASNIKKSLTGLPMQQGSQILNARSHISKAPNVKAIMGLQDMWVCHAFNACKICEQAATMLLKCNAGPIDHSPSTATMSGNPSARRHAADHMRRGGTIGLDAHHIVEDIICYF
jgi:hypothetical protein